MHPVLLILGTLLVCVLTWELVTAKVHDPSRNRTYTRKGNPGWYWLAVLFHAAMLVAILVLGRTWH